MLIQTLDDSPRRSETVSRQNTQPKNRRKINSTGSSPSWSRSEPGIRFTPDTTSSSVSSLIRTPLQASQIDRT